MVSKQAIAVRRKGKSLEISHFLDELSIDYFTNATFKAQCLMTKAIVIIKK